MNVRIYARVSHEEQVKFGYSIDAQIKALKDYCKERDYNIMATYIDEGISAYSVEKRHEFKKMIADAKPNEIILFTKLDRFSRNILDANLILLELKKKNVSIKAINEDDIDTTTADGKFLFDLKLSLAERERNKTSERIRDVFKYKALKGEALNASPPFGYKIVNKRYVIDEEKAEAVRKLFEHYVTYGNLFLSVRWWNETFAFKKTYDTMKRMLKNTTYTGKHKYNDDYCEPIISEEVFNKAQNIMKKNGRERKSQRTYIFKGLIKCSKCGNRMSGSIHTRKSVDKKGVSKTHFTKVYRCNKARVSGLCDNKHTFAETRLEKYLLDNMDTLIDADIKARKKPKKTKDYSKEIAQIKKKMSKLKDLYLDDLISKQEYEADYRPLKERLDEISHIEPIKNDTEIKSLKGMNIRGIYEKMNDDTKHMFWLGIIDRIEYDGVNFKVVFK